MRRVSVVGNSGSGKTTLARRLAARLGVSFIELDAIHHQPGWRPLPLDEFRARVADALDAAVEGWVVDGNYRARVGDLIAGRADTVVWLDYGRPVVMRQVVARTVRRVVTREKLWNGNREPLSNLWSRDPYRSIIVWAWTRHGAYRRQYEDEESSARPEQRWVRLRSPAETRRWLASN